MRNFFKKYTKIYSGATLGCSCLNLGKNEYRALSVFKYSNYVLSCKKSEKTNDPFLVKNSELTDRQRDNSDF